MTKYEQTRHIDDLLVSRGFKTKWFNNYEQVNIYGYVDDMMTFYPFSNTIVFRHNGELLSRKGDVDTVIGALSSEALYDGLVKGADDGEQTTLF